MKDQIEREKLFEVRQIEKRIDALRPLYQVHEMKNSYLKRPKENPHKAEMDELTQRYVALVGTLKPEPVLGVIGTIYVVGYGPYVKIGWTKGPVEGRLRSLRTGAPEPLIVYGTFKGSVQEERELHARFAEYRLQGEWFRREGLLGAWITGGCKI